MRLKFTVNSIDTFVPFIDDKAINFIARVDCQNYFDIKVKTFRLTKDRYFYDQRKIGRNYTT